MVLHFQHFICNNKKSLHYFVQGKIKPNKIPNYRHFFIGVRLFLEDWSFVFKPPVICKMVGSSKYAPLTNLPSQVQSVSLPSNCVYKPSWVQHMENSKNLQNLNNTSSSGVSASNASSRNRTPTPSVPNNVHQNAGIFPPSPLHPAGKFINYMKIGLSIVSQYCLAPC